MLGNSLAFSRNLQAGSVVSSAVTRSMIAGEIVGYPRIVTLVGGKAMLFMPTGSVQGNTVGITRHSAILNAPVEVTISGIVTYIGWGLTPNVLHFAVASGLLSTVPPSTGLIQPMGLALDADSLLLHLDSTIELL